MVSDKFIPTYLIVSLARVLKCRHVNTMDQNPSWLGKLSGTIQDIA